MATQTTELPTYQQPEQKRGPRMRPLFIGKAAVELSDRPHKLVAPNQFRVANVPARNNFTIPPEARRPLEQAFVIKQYGVDANLIAAISFGDPKAEEYKSFLFLRLTGWGYKHGELDRLIKTTALAGKPRSSSRAVLLEDLPGGNRAPKGLIINVGDIVHFGTGERCTKYFDLPPDLEPYHCTLYYNDAEVLTVMNQTPQPNSVFVAVGKSVSPEADLPPRARIP